jgi:hypothetical protein
MVAQHSKDNAENKLGMTGHKGREALIRRLFALRELPGSHRARIYHPCQIRPGVDQSRSYIFSGGSE